MSKVRNYWDSLDDGTKNKVKQRGIAYGLVGLVLCVLALIFVSKTAGLFLGLVALVVVGLSIADVLVSDQTEDAAVAIADGLYYEKDDGTMANDTEIQAHLADPTANPLTVVKVKAGDPLPESIGRSQLQANFPGQVFEHVKAAAMFLCGAIVLAALLYRGGDVPPTPLQEYLDSFVGYVQQKKTVVDTSVKPQQPVPPIDAAPEITADMKTQITRVSDTEASVPKAKDLRWVLIHEGKARYIEVGRAGVLERGDKLHFSASTSLNGGRVYVVNAAGVTSETIPLPTK